jgi:Family of unknown function (DUF6200)
MNAQSTSASAKAPEGAKSTTEHDGPRPHPTIILDLGRASKKRVDQLRKGRGKLMARVDEALEDLRSAGTVGEAAQPVVLIVKQRSKLRSLKPLDLLPMKLK